MMQQLEHRDLSWLGFNQRVLEEAAHTTVPLLERIRFLSIFSSNLDEFYRVRIPALAALNKISSKNEDENVLGEINTRIGWQLRLYGEILEGQILPSLEHHGYHLHYRGELPADLLLELRRYFLERIAGYIRIVKPGEDKTFFPANNALYLAVVVKNNDTEQLYLVNIPADKLGRFLIRRYNESNWIIFLEDVVSSNLSLVFKDPVIGAWNIKITRDAELEMRDEYGDNLAEKIEKKLATRDFGYATRVLYQPDLPLRHLQYFIHSFSLEKAFVVEGGPHHNLKDFGSLDLPDAVLKYAPWPAVAASAINAEGLLLSTIRDRDIMLSTPYHSYEPVIRFFNEAAFDMDVTEIYVTLYRVATESRITEALISAAHNGKKVVAVVELKARFDEANNIKWSKKMKAAGVQIVYSDASMKVHAKLALIRTKDSQKPWLGLFATGNMNEQTARFYTDQIILTSDQRLLNESRAIFRLLEKKNKPGVFEVPETTYLILSPVNMLRRFTELVDREIGIAKSGRTAIIRIKLNNLEEKKLIAKLYEASNSGVIIQLIVRGICCLIPGLTGQSENITVRRVVDRYLEHGRLFIFGNGGSPEVFLGSADWMNRNVYRRIEVCFPVYDQQLSENLRRMFDIQWSDNTQATEKMADCNYQPVAGGPEKIRAQELIYEWISGSKKEER